MAINSDIRELYFLCRCNLSIYCACSSHPSMYCSRMRDKTIYWASSTILIDILNVYKGLSVRFIHIMCNLLYAEQTTRVAVKNVDVEHRKLFCASSIEHAHTKRVDDIWTIHTLQPGNSDQGKRVPSDSQFDAEAGNCQYTER